MQVILHDADYALLDAAALRAWAEVPAAVASDCLNRGHTMAGALTPLSRTMRIAAQARTVQLVAADNSALHAAIGLCRPGEVLVADAHGFEDTAVFGGLMLRAAQAAGLAGLVVDGAVRDSAEIEAAGFPVFSRGAAPAGPHKEFGGEIDGVIACGGVAVAPGDLILADADGVTVVPGARIASTWVAVQAFRQREAAALAAIARGVPVADVFGVARPVRAAEAAAPPLVRIAADEAA